MSNRGSSRAITRGNRLTGLAALGALLVARLGSGCGGPSDLSDAPAGDVEQGTGGMSGGGGQGAPGGWGGSSTSPASGGSSTSGVGGSGAQASVTVAIEPGLPSYSAVMSSVPGLPLRPIASGSPPTNSLYRWRADYGSFALWQPSDYHVIDQGSDFTVGDTTVYWNYFSPPADTLVPVLIRLDLLDGTSGEVLARAELALSWTDQGGVTVQ